MAGIEIDIPGGPRQIEPGGGALVSSAAANFRTHQFVIDELRTDTRAEGAGTVPAGKGDGATRVARCFSRVYDVLADGWQSVPARNCRGTRARLCPVPAHA